jgi:uncharacterized protein
MRARLTRLLAPLFLLAVFVLLVPAAASALDVPPVPTDVPIVDQTNTLTAEQKASLANTIATERQHSGNQIGVLMIPSLQGEALEDYSLKVARTWGIGTKDRDSGVLLLIVKNDRKIRIEVGYGLEGALPDIRAGQIIRNRMAPLFQQGKYYEGVESGLQGITAAIHNEVDPQLSNPNPPEQSKPPFPWEVVFIAIFILPTWLASILGRTKSWWAGGVLGGVGGIILSFFIGFLFFGLISIVGLVLIGLLFDKGVSANYRKRAGSGSSPSWWAGGPWIGGGRGGSGGSGGFGGFGGGGFGGGGASGGW